MHGFTFVFDRVTSEPIWPIEERTVDTATDVPGEVLYPTQPFPTKPPPFSLQGVSLDDANDLTPEIHALAVPRCSGSGWVRSSRRPAIWEEAHSRSRQNMQ